MRLAAIILLTICTLGASGQSLFDKPMDIRQITVSGTKPVRESGVTRTVVDSAAFAESSNVTFAELLARHTPVFIKSYGLGSMATVSFRGTAASHTQVEWNGININNPMLGQVDFSMIPVWFIDKTELLHGGSSLMSGSGSLGGSVIIGSQPRWGDKIYGAVMQGIGSFGNYQTSVVVGGGGAKFQAKIRYIYQQARNDFEFLNTAVPPFEYERQKNADYHKHGAVADLYWRLGGGHNLSINAWFHTADRNLPTIMSYEGLGRQEWQTDNELRIVGRWQWYGPKVKSELTSGFSATSLDYFLANNTDMGRVVNYDSRSRVESFQNRYKFEWMPTASTSLRATANADIHNVSTLDHITKEGYAAHRTDVGVSVSGHQRLGGMVSGYVLARYESNGAFMPSVGVEVEPVKSLIFKINGTRNYHQPTLNDLHWLPGGNPDLKPEKGYTADLSAGYTMTSGRWGAEFSAVGYMSKISDWIIWRPSEYRYWTATNIRKVFSRGVEASAEGSYTANGLKISLNGNYAFTRTTNEEPDLEGDASEGRQLIYIPVHKANAMLNASYHGFYACYTWSYTGERFTNSSNEATRHTLPAYDLHNVSVGKTFFGFDVQLRVDNLFGKDYQAILWRAMPRRNYNILIKYSF